MRRSALPLILLAPVALAAWSPQRADAQEVRFMRNQLSVEDWRKSLLPESRSVGTRAMVKSRKIEINMPAPPAAITPASASAPAPAAVASAAPADPAPAPAPKQAASPAPPPAEPAAEAGQAEIVAVPISFGFDSAELLPEWLPTLDTLGQLLHEAPDLRLTIEGHTDAVGEAGYNLSLSRRRAASVQAYLVDKYGIAPDRLAVVGKGMSEPLAQDPADPANRRVQFRRGG